MPLYWYALRSKPRKEDVVWRQLRTQGFDVYYPRLKVQPVNPALAKSETLLPWVYVRTGRY